MPSVHRGEPQLWLGRYPEARADASYDRRAAAPCPAAGRRVRTAGDVLRSDYASALPVTDTILRDDPRDGEA
jgi:hypothetical protein